MTAGSLRRVALSGCWFKANGVAFALGMWSVSVERDNFGGDFPNVCSVESNTKHATNVEASSTEVLLTELS